MDFNNQPAYIFTSDGKTYKCVANEVHVRDELAQSFAANVQFHVKNVFVLPEIGPVNMSVSANEAVYVTRLKHIKLNSFYEIRGDVFIPKFLRNDIGAAANFIRLNLQWNVPNNMKLYFGMKLMNQGQDFRYIESYLWAKHPTISGDWRLPLPNYYETGKLCLGTATSIDNREFARLRNAQEILSRVINIFYSSQWNGDLPPNETNAQLMFKFNNTNNMQVPLGADFNWTTTSVRFSNQNILNANVDGL